MRAFTNIQRFTLAVLCGLGLTTLVMAADEEVVTEEVAVESYVVVQDEDGNVIYEGSGEDSNIDVSGMQIDLSGITGALSGSGKGGADSDKIRQQIQKSLQAQMGQMRTRRLAEIKKRLGVTDEEWKVIEPRVTAVLDLSDRGGFMRMSAAKTADPIEEAQKALQQTLDKDAPTTAEVKAKLAALRGAREKSKQQLLVARKKLAEVLTIKQEAILVMMRILE